jgi:YD repeat-containing protein
VRVLIFIPLLLLSVQLIFAQSANTLAFPSSNNSFLGRGGSTTQTGVDPYTGTAQVNIPICNLSSLDLSIPVSLAYADGRGVKIQEYASQVGLGWQLNAGGGISRVVRGFPDEQSNGYLGNGTLPSGAIGTGGQWGKVVANELSSTVVWTNSQFTAITGINASNGSAGLPTADGEPDIYYVKTPYFNFQFTFDENGNVVTPNGTGIKIIGNNFLNSNGSNTSFKAIDQMGNQYFFGSTSASVENTTSTLFNVSTTFPTTWYLDKIVSFNSRDVIAFGYTSYFASDVNNHYMSTTYYDGTGHVNTDNTPVTTTVLQPKFLTSIVGPLGEIDLAYATGRQDDASSVSLSSITLKAYNPQTSSISTTLKTFNFNYSYFGTPSTDPNVLRLRLDNITVTGNTTLTATPVTLKSFTYNTSINLPSRTSLSSVDYFGYYTYYSGTNTYNSSLPANATYAAADILVSVKDITGSSWNFFYELNDYYNTSTSANTPVGGLRVNKLSQTLPSGENIFTTYSYNDASAHSTGQILSNSYLINIGYSSCGVDKIFSESPSDYYDLNGNFVGYSSVKSTDQTGGYIVSTFTNFSSYPDNLNYSSSNPNGIPDITSSISLAYKRGLLLDQAVYDASGNILTDDATPIANYASLTTQTKKAYAYHWANMVFTVSGSGYTNSCAFGASSTYWAYVENFRPTRTIHTDYDQVTHTASVQKTINYTYSTVNNRLTKTVTSTDSKGQSLTKTYYYPDESGIPMVSGSPEQSSITGLVTANRTDQPIHETDNRNGTITQAHNTYSTTVNNNIYLTQTSAYMSDPVNTTTTLIKQQNNTYDAGTSNLASTSLNGGKPTGYYYRYKSAIPVATVVNAVNTYNTTMVSAQQYASIGLSAGNYGSTSFTTSVVGNILLQISANPGTTYTIYYSLTGPSSSSGYLCAARSATTCSYGESVTLPNMPIGTYSLSIQLNSGTTSYLGISATYSALVPSTTVTPGFFYEGFEENTVPVTYGTAHSGNGYYSGSYGVAFTPPDSRSYLIQWWSWAAGKWTMHQQAYTGAMSITGFIDDVRIFPSDALMTSMTYNPLVGETGETDPAGRTITTEYDGLGRINMQRDFNRNILFKDCYNYAGQTISCPAATLYSNTVQSQTFARNNCGTGYLSGTATYTVNAGTYTSTISQADANQQALNDISLNGQNYANTNGTCTQVWYNVAESGSFTRNNCSAGYAGTTVTYTVNANAYSSTISQADANQKAINDVNTNGQTYANTNGVCNPTATQHFGDLVLSGGSASVTFTTTIVGTITLSADGNPGATYGMSYTLSGPSTKSGSLCVSRTSVSCGSVPSSATFTSMPIGTYTLTIQPGTGSSSYKGMSYSYYGN